jgi:hypothetical protein
MVFGVYATWTFTGALGGAALVAVAALLIALVR